MGVNEKYWSRKEKKFKSNITRVNLVGERILNNFLKSLRKMNINFEENFRNVLAKFEKNTS